MLSSLLKTYTILLILCISFLVLTNSFSSLLFTKNFQNSIQEITTQGTYPSIGPSIRSIVLDNFTDALILNTSNTVDSTNPLKSSLQNNRHLDPQDPLSQIKGLTGTQTTTYERYWHGNQIIYRPLLLVSSFLNIKIIIKFFMYLLCLYFLFLIFNQDKALFMGYVLGFFYTDFFQLSGSLQFSPVFIVGIISAIFCLKYKKTTHDYFLICFTTGCLTSYFDLLTAPLVTLGFILPILSYKSKLNFYKIIFFWLLGYSLFWSTKWIISTVYNPTSIQTSLQQIKNRTINIPDSNFSYYKTIQLNIAQLIGYSKPSKIFTLLLLTFLFIFILKNINKYYLQKNLLSNLLLPAFLPYIWYLVASNHSYLHVWYTYRTQFITVVCLVYTISRPLLRTSKNHRN